MEHLLSLLETKPDAFRMATETHSTTSWHHVKREQTTAFFAIKTSHHL
jgi:hypothetical protein